MGRGAAQEFLTLYNSYLIQVAWYMVDASLKRREIKVMPAWKWMCNKMKNDSLIYQELLDINGK